jgi:hypothetical protein
LKTCAIIVKYDILRLSCEFVFDKYYYKLLTLSSVYSLFSALIMHVYQMRSTNKSVVSATEQRLQICMGALKEISKVWLVAKMVHTLFESILGNKTLEERLQKAAGKRHRKLQQPNIKREEQQKRKIDDTDFGFANGPAHQVSYERSRPQTPALTPSREAAQTNGMPQFSGGSPQISRQQPGDGFMGTGQSRGNTRPTTPFNPTISYPGTPPEIYLVTRNSPNISSTTLWHNFQPDQLFPAETNLNLPFASVSPIQQHTLVDPALSSGSSGHLIHTPDTPVNMQNGMLSTTLGSHANDLNAWAQMDGMNQVTNDDTWSNSSKSQGPIVPTTLNVEDWYAFLTFSQLQSC